MRFTPASEPPEVVQDTINLGASTEGQLVYAVGDVHGRYDLLTDLLDIVVQDSLRIARGRRPILVFCGDYVDRGPASAQVVEAMVWLKRRSDFEVHLLKGNHEQALLGFIEEPEKAAAWLEFGGVQTLVSYGVAPPDPKLGLDDRRRARDDLTERMPASHLRLLEALKVMALIGDYAFVHAGIRPGRALSRQDEQDLLWIRKDFLLAPGPHEKIIVHGHTWKDDKPELLDHRIGIDTGAYATGTLTALRLEDGSGRILQARLQPPR